MVAKTVGTTARLAGCTFQKVAMMAMAGRTLMLSLAAFGLLGSCSAVGRDTISLTMEGCALCWVCVNATGAGVPPMEQDLGFNGRYWATYNEHVRFGWLEFLEGGPRDRTTWRILVGART